MAKQLNVNLNIDAQTGKAKQALTELNKILTDIQTNRTITVNDKSLQEAKQAASDLKFHLAQATSVDTGKLNLGAFSQSLKKAGQDLNTLYNKLSVIGPEGQQAFLALSQSIVQADHASLTLGNRLSQLGTTLKNTARWQLSSTLLHGFMGALQGAYGYAQDLNKSLNNIRIVTGQSIDDMARFAEEANRAAKSLSTSTTAYTDAALIYYQQGLTDQAVKERTETTLKLSNVSRQSAEEVSSQMTAIWNNFADGSKNLEYYADVITKLGAATAASSAEISDGIQKFAAVADTVGLSYEKATAALATVVAETRQSADVVGTAFKTMFARFQGLELGETLEDGVTLNKYAEAINTVGVNILKANGDLKDMDTILDELGERWNSIGQAQKVALAETVAGTRQYAQFMAIMENYDKILANQDLAAGAEGTLQKQADIYAESWEAASKRVRAAAQGIYQDLIDDKFFITALNGLEKFIGTIDGAIKGIGGLKTVLLSVGAIIASKYATEMPVIMQKLIGNFNVLTGAAEKQRITMLQDADAIIQKMNATEAGNKGLEAQIGSMQLVSKMTTELEQKKKNLSKTEIENYELKIKEVQMYGQVAAAIGKEIEALEKEASAQRLKIRSGLNIKGNLTSKYYTDEETQQIGSLQSEITDSKNFAAALEGQEKSKKKLGELQQHIKNLEQEYNNLIKTSGKTSSQMLKDFSNLSEKAGKMASAYNETTERAKAWQQALSSGKADINKTKEEILAYADIMKKAGFNTDEFTEKIQNASSADQLRQALELLIDTDGKLAYQMYDTDAAIDEMKQILMGFEIPESELNRLEELMRKSGSSSQEFAAALEMVKQKYQTLQPHTISLSESFAKLGSAAMALSSAINAIKNIGRIWSDDDLSNGEKFLQTLTSIGMLLPALNTLLDANTLKVLASSFSFKGLTAAIHSTTGATVTFSTVLKALPFGWILVAIGALIGAIALIAKAIETPAEKLKRLKQEQENLREATEKVNEEWKKFQNTLSSYDEGLKGLQELTKGTVEFNEQLEKVNETAEDLINTLSLVFGEDYYFDTSGIKVFTQSGRKKIETANSSIEKGQSSLNWINLLSQNEVQKAEYEDKYGKTQSDRGYYARERGYDVISSQYDQIYKQEYDQLYTTISDLLKDGLSSEEISTEIAKQYSSLGFLGEDSENILKNASSLTQSFLKIIDNVNQVEATPFHYDYNQESAWIASQLDLTNPYSQIVAQNAFNSQEQVENDLSKAVADYNNKQEDKIEYEWEQLFGALADKGESLLESGISKREYLAQYSVGQEYLQQAEKTLAEIANINFSKNNNDVLTQIATGNLQNISPEQMANFNLEKISQTDIENFGKLWELLYGQPLNNTEEYLQRIKKQVYNVNDFYRTQIIGLDTIQEKVKDLNKTFGSLKLGDTIEDISDLSEEMQSYFVKMEDGTFKLVGDAEQFQAALFRKKSQDYEKDLQTFVNLSQIPERYEIQVGANGQVASQSWSGLTEDEGVKFQDTAISYAMTADSLQQLNQVKEKFNELSVPEELQIQAINTALQDLATKYDTCNDELQKFQFALKSEDEQLIINARDTLEYSIHTAELAEKIDLAVDDIEDQARAFQKTNEELKTNVSDLKEQQKVATKMAVLNQSMNKGVSTLSKNWKDWNKILQEADKDSMDYIDTIQEMRVALSDLLGITNSELIPKDFFENKDNIDLMGKAAEGDAQSINLLGTAFAKASFESQKFIEGMNISLLEDDIRNNFDIADIISGAFIDAEAAFNYYKDNVLEGIGLLEKEILNGNLEVGTDLTKIMDGTGASWVDSLNQMAIATGMSVEDMRSMLNALGIEAEIGVKEETVTQHVPRYHTTEQVTEIPNGTTTLYDKWTTTVIDGYDDIPGVMEVAQINMGEENAGKQPKTIRYTGRSTPSSSVINNNDSGGSGKSSEKEPTHSAKHTDAEEHRYTRVENNLSSISDQYDRLSKARDRAWGIDQLGIMDSEISKMEELSDAYEDYLNEVAGTNWEALHKKIQAGEKLTLADIANSGGYLGKDYNAIMNGKELEIVVDIDAEGNETVKKFAMEGLVALLGEYGITDLELDAHGRINNQNEIDTAFDQWYSAQEGWWHDLTAEQQQDVANVNKWKEIEAIKNAFPTLFELYAEDIEKLEKNSDALQDAIYAIQDLKFDQLNKHLEMSVDINERQIKQLQYSSKILGDSIYKTSEVMSNLFNPNRGSQYQEWLSIGQEYQNYYDEAKKLYEAGELSQAQYIDAAKKAQDGIYGVIDSLLEMNEQMRQYYSKVLDQAVAELTKLTDQMEHQVNVMEHLKNILSLLNRQTDYKAMDTLIRGSVHMRRNALDEATKEYEMFNEQLKVSQQRYEQLLADGLEEGAREYKEAVLDKITAQTIEAEEKMYASAEAYLEAVNELYENTVASILAEQEKMLTGGFGWDYLSESMGRASAIQDEYLTKTNQIYETNTLLSKLSKDIDKTNNITSKNKLKSFSDEIAAMQQQEKLSQTDLAIAKARYEVLVAELALEDAKNAKSTVRLQRDNEGNYGYVYTADADDIADAEQNLAAKQNDLYNLVLKQTNDYGQKIIELEKERDAALAALAEEYRGADGEKYEEYLRKKEDLTRQYNELLYAAYESYDTSIVWLNRTASIDYREAWVTEYENVIDKGRDYQEQTEDVFAQIEIAMEEYKDQATAVTDHVYLGLDNLKEKTSELITANDKLTEAAYALTEQLSTELEEVNLATEAWARHYEEIMRNIEALQKYNEHIDDDINSELYDKDTDYSELMYQYLKKGGSMSDDEFKKLKRQREAKIEGENITAEKYGYRGDDFRNLLNYYLGEELREKGYSQYFTHGFTQFAEDQGTTAADLIKIPYEEYIAQLEENTKALATGTEAQQSDAEKITEAATNVVDSIKTNLEVHEETTRADLDANEQAIKADLETAQQSISDTEQQFESSATEILAKIEASIENLISTLMSASGEVLSSSSMLSGTMMSAASMIASAAGTVMAAAAEVKAAQSSSSSSSSSEGGGFSGGGGGGNNVQMAFASGGYTGSWGPDGKIAILHEKELVLNANDTENILSAVGLIREFSSAIDMRAAANNVSSGLIIPNYQTGSQVIEQEVTIHAEFPNATNHNEIEEAFSNLVNRASQYANREF